MDVDEEMEYEIEVENVPLESTLPLLELPVLVHDLIIDQSNLESKKNLRATCKYLQKAVDRTVKFIPLLTDASADTILNRSFSCIELNVCDLVGPRSLSVSVDKKFYDIQTLGFYSDPEGQTPVSQLNFFRVLRHCTQVSQLLISGNVLLSFQILSKNFYKSIRLDGLRVLKLSFDGTGDRHSALEALQYARFPQLKELVVWIMAPDQHKLSPFEFEGLTKMLVAHHLSIRHLHIFDYGYALPRGFRLNIFLTPVRTAPILGVEKVQLESLVIVDAYDDPEKRIQLQWAYAGTLLENQRELRTLILIFPCHFLRPMIQSAVRQSHQTLLTFYNLGYVDVRGTQINVPSIVTFDCADLRQCSLIRHLRLYSLHAVENFVQLPITLEELFWDAPLTRAQLNHIARNMNSVKSLQFGTTVGYVPTALVIRTLYLPSLTSLYISICDRVVIGAILQEWFRGVVIYEHPYIPGTGARIFVDRNEFGSNIPIQQLEDALQIPPAIY